MKVLFSRAASRLRADVIETSITAAVDFKVIGKITSKNLNNVSFILAILSSLCPVLVLI